MNKNLLYFLVCGSFYIIHGADGAHEAPHDLAYKATKAQLDTDFRDGKITKEEREERLKAARAIQKSERRKHLTPEQKEARRERDRSYYARTADVQNARQRQRYHEKKEATPPVEKKKRGDLSVADHPLYLERTAPIKAQFHSDMAALELIKRTLSPEDYEMRVYALRNNRDTALLMLRESVIKDVPELRAQRSAQHKKYVHGLDEAGREKIRETVRKSLKKSAGHKRDRDEGVHSGIASHHKVPRTEEAYGVSSSSSSSSSSAVAAPAIDPFASIELPDWDDFEVPLKPGRGFSAGAVSGGGSSSSSSAAAALDARLTVEENNQRLRQAQEQFSLGAMTHADYMQALRQYRENQKRFDEEE